MPNKFELLITPNKGKLYEISIWDNIENYEDYDKLIEHISKIDETDHVNLKVSTPGGRCDIGFMLIDRIMTLPCSIEVVVPYPTYSMGAIMALCGDSLEIQPGAFLMLHDYSTGTKGKGNEIFKQTEAYKEAFEYKFKEVCQPFLSKKECTDVLNGKDLYIKWNDPSLEKRIKRHYR